METQITYGANGFPAVVIADGAAVVIGPTPTNTKVNPTDPGGEVTPNILEETGKTWDFVPWGPGNDAPRQIMCEIEKSGVASQALQQRMRTIYGQKVVPVRVVGFDPVSGQEKLEEVTDPEILAFLRRSNLPELRYRCIADMVHLSMAVPMICLNQDRSKVAMVTHDKVSKFRFSPFDPVEKRVKTMVRSANWPNPMQSQKEYIANIDSFNWYLEVDRVRFDPELQVKYTYPIKAYDVMRDYYPTNYWNGLFINGWLENSNAIPQIIKAIIKNSITLKFHIQIPDSWWTSKWPKFLTMEQKDRDAIVNKVYDDINDFLTNASINAAKTFISNYAVDKTTGKAGAGWIITPVEDKMKNDAWNTVALAANNEILFAIGVNPASIGLNSPTGTNGGANNGGSNIREAGLSATVQAQLERDLLYGWWRFVSEYNGYDPLIELRTIDNSLTTLDTGAGTDQSIN